MVSNLKHTSSKTVNRCAHSDAQKTRARFKGVRATMRYLAILLVMASFIARAEIHKEAFPTEAEMQFRWWPVMPKVEGWAQDREFSIRYGINAQVPIGKSFSNSETVIYSKAIYKPRVPDIKSLEEFIENDKSSFLEKEPSISISKESEFTNPHGTEYIVYSFTPNESGNWEYVTYSEEGEFYLVFTVSSRSELGLKTNLEFYNSFLKSYAKEL